MAENFVYLSHGSEAECQLSQQRLQEAGIDCRIEDYEQNAYFGVYGADSLLGKKIIVPETRLAAAKELLGVTDSEKDSFYFSKSQNPLHIVARILIAAFLIVFLGLLIFSFMQNLSH